MKPRTNVPLSVQYQIEKQHYADGNAKFSTLIKYNCLQSLSEGIASPSTVPPMPGSPAVTRPWPEHDTHTYEGSFKY